MSYELLFNRLIGYLLIRLFVESVIREIRLFVLIREIRVFLSFDFMTFGFRLFFNRKGRKGITQRAQRQMSYELLFNRLFVNSVIRLFGKFVQFVQFVQFVFFFRSIISSSIISSSIF
jgi:hypothetical protein